MDLRLQPPESLQLVPTAARQLHTVVLPVRCWYRYIYYLSSSTYSPLLLIYSMCIPCGLFLSPSLPSIFHLSPFLQYATYYSFIGPQSSARTFFSISFSLSTFPTLPLSLHICLLLPLVLACFRRFDCVSEVNFCSNSTLSSRCT